MKTRLLGTSAWLLIFGAAAILFIGAFARFDPTGGQNSNPPGGAAPPSAAALEPGDPTEAAGGPALPANLSPGLDEVIRLAQAHVGDDVILAFVKNSGRTYDPSSDELLYLTDLGVSQKVLEALFVRKPAEAAAVAASAPAPPSPPGLEPAEPASEPSVRTVSASAESALAAAQEREGLISPPAAPAESEPLDDAAAASYFYDFLAPYGSWVDLGQQGRFWQPAVVTMIVGWQPYRDHGRWRYTDSGWYWQSDYSWGWAAFHYGRWLNHPRFGWLWNPGQTWAPAWVAWRNTADYAGWAPLPPGAPFDFGSAPAVNPAGLGLGFALSASAFTFVRYTDFTAAAVAGYVAPAGKGAALFKVSKPVNNYLSTGNQTLNPGIGVEYIAAATHRPVKQFILRDVSSASSVNNNTSGGALAVYRPAIAHNAARPALLNSQARLSQSDEVEDPMVPARAVLARGDDTTPSRSDDRPEAAIPRTAPLETPGWSMRKFSLSSGASHASFQGGRFAGRFGFPNGGLSSGFYEHGAGAPSPGPASPVFRGHEPSGNRPSAYEGPPAGAEPRAAAAPSTGGKK